MCATRSVPCSAAPCPVAARLARSSPDRAPHASNLAVSFRTRNRAAASATARTSRASATCPNSVPSAAESKTSPPLITATCAKNHSTPETSSTASASAATRRARGSRTGVRATHARKANSPASEIAAAKWKNRATAISSDTLRRDLEAELAVRDVAVGGEYAPDNAVGARRERGQRHLEELRFGLVDARVLAVDLLAVLVEHLHGAEGGLERVREPQLHLGGGPADGARRLGRGAVEVGVREDRRRGERDEECEALHGSKCTTVAYNPDDENPPSRRSRGDPDRCRICYRANLSRQAGAHGGALPGGRAGRSRGAGAVFRSEEHTSE